MIKKVIKNILVPLVLLISCSLAAQEKVPLEAKYSCSLNSTMTFSGTMDSACFAPQPPYSDGYRCYFYSSFNTIHGDIGLVLSLVIPEKFFTVKTKRLTTDLFCLGTSNVFYYGQEKRPFVYQNILSGFGTPRSHLLKECGLFLRLESPITISNYSNSLNSDGSENGEGEDISCRVVVS